MPPGYHGRVRRASSNSGPKDGPERAGCWLGKRGGAPGVRNPFDLFGGNAAVITDVGTPLQSAHWPALDGLRGAAVATVVAFHLGWFNGGFLGVDLFFVLSGFLITRLLVDEAERTGTVSLRRFWDRRFRRLLPAVTVMIVAVMWWLARYGTPSERSLALGDARWALPYLANWHQIAVSHDYWAAATSSSAFTHLWSLAIEEQFYVLWPLVAWLVIRVARARFRLGLSTIAICGVVASASAMVWWYDPSAPSRVYLGTDTRVFGMLCGAALAIWRPPALPARIGHPASWSVSACLIGSWFVAGDHFDLLFHGGLLLHALLATLLVHLIVTGGNARMLDRVLASRPLTWLGRRSYGLYLWHWPVIVLLAPRLWSWPSVSRDIVVLAVSLGITVASYELLEQPIRLRRAWATGGRARAATALAVLAALTTCITASDGAGEVAGFDPSSISRPTPGQTIDSTAVVDMAPGPAQTVGSTPGTTAVSALDTTSDPAAGTTAVSAVDPVGALTSTSNRVLDEFSLSVVGALGWAGSEIEGVRYEGAGASAAPRPSLGRRTSLPSATRVLWVGDSVAADEAPAIIAALAATGVSVLDGAYAGRRLVASDGVDVAPMYETLLDDASPQLVITQLSLWDAPFSGERQRAALSWFRDLVVGRGASLIFVTPPPIRPDLVDPGMQRQIAIAAEIAASDPEHVRLLDSSAVWGLTVHADLDGDLAPDRKPDLVHVCPQGAARLTIWLTEQLTQQVGGFVPAPIGEWVTGTWNQDQHYDTPVGACVALAPSAG